MAQVTVTVNDKNYVIACDSGQEDHLARLAQFVNRRVEELVANVGQVGDTRLLLMACLLIADELSEFSTEFVSGRDQNSVDLENALMVDDVISLASRIESIAEKLEDI